MFSKKILARGMVLVAVSFLAISLPLTPVKAIALNPVYSQGVVQLPQCPFTDSPGVYVKHNLCSWENERCEINTLISNAGQSNCSHMCWGVNKVASGERGGVYAASALTLAGGTQLCTTTSNPNQVNLPICPFSGETGEIWIKPVYTNWNAGSKCLVGTDCWRQPVEISLGSVAAFGLQFDVGGSLNARTWADNPGKAFSYSQVTGISMPWAYETCIVKSTTTGNGGDGATPPPTGQSSLASGTLTASATSVQADQPVTITVAGEDADGLQYVGLKKNNEGWQWSDRGSATTLSKEWTFSTNQPGTYTFYGVVNGTNPLLTDSQKLEIINPTPSQLTITVTGGSGGTPPPTGQNSPASGTLTASATSVQADQPVTITVSGTDDDGLQYVGLKKNNEGWQWSDRGSGTTLSKEWTFSTNQPGTYTFSGVVNGTNPLLTDSQKLEIVKTIPQEITITVTASGGSAGDGDTGEGSAWGGANIHLPVCDFYNTGIPMEMADKNAIWAKNASCAWNNKCPLGYQCNSSCGLLGIFHLDTVSNFSIQSLCLPAFANPFDLCIQGDPTDFSVAPPCPFSGTEGDVWVSPNPASGSLVNWNTRVKVGTSIQQSFNPFSGLSNLQELVDQAQNLGISIELDDPGIAQMLDQSLKNVGITIEIDSFSDLLGLTKYLKQIGTVLSQIQIPNAGFNIQTYSDQPGRVGAGISNAGFFLQLPTPVKVCLVGGTAQGSFISNMSVPGAPASKPSVKTNAAKEIGTNKATLGGKLTDKGGAPSPLVRIEWGTTSQYGNHQDHFYATVKTSIWGDWEMLIEGLAPGTTYHFRAVAINNAGSTYGNDLTFTTLGTSAGDATGTGGTGDTGPGGTGGTGTGGTGTGETGTGGTGTGGGCGCGGTGDAGINISQATVVTLAAVQVADHEATLKGQLLDLGNCWPDRASVYFEWGTTSGYGDSQFIDAADRPGTFSLPLSNLLSGTTYYFRMRASNCAGATYGQSRSFTTSGKSIPGAAERAIITTQPISNITSSEATLNGKIESLGIWTSGMVYFDWQRSGTTCSANSPFVTVVYQPQSVHFDLHHLSPNTTYQVRIKVAGSHPGEWVYGSYVTFTTKSQ